jgi:hypothetical protein
MRIAHRRAQASDQLVPPMPTATRGSANGHVDAQDVREDHAGHRWRRVAEVRMATLAVGGRPGAATTEQRREGCFAPKPKHEDPPERVAGWWERVLFPPPRSLRERASVMAVSRRDGNFGGSATIIDATSSKVLRHAS